MWRRGAALVAAAASCAALQWIGPDEAVPIEAAPDEAAPDEAAPDEADPDEADPDEAGGLCKEGLLEYEAVVGALCKVYCLPPGECEARGQSQGLSAFGITGPGNCTERGFTDPAEIDQESSRQSRYFKTLGGPCQGMALGGVFSDGPPALNPSTETPKRQHPWRWHGGQRGAPKGDPSAAEISEARCDESQGAYTAIHGTAPGICILYCVPPGECEALSQAGPQALSGSSGGPEGCRSLGYTEPLPAAPGPAQVYQGPCSGMRTFSFVKPTLIAADQGY